MSKVKINKKSTVEELLKQGTIVTTKEGKEYFYCPYWFEYEGDSLIMYGFNKLPDDLTEKIKLERL